ncbi:MAG: rRNA maturation RNase YbeY [Candidatus Entotheonellia bacterium]
MLAALDQETSDLSVLVIDDARMQRLNDRYRGIDRPTDVLAFAMREGASPQLNPQLMGDVVISAETALRQARGRRRSFTEELTHLLIHGTLHLLGYDHEASPAAARVMGTKARALWKLVAPLLIAPPQPTHAASRCPCSAKTRHRGTQE